MTGWPDHKLGASWGEMFWRAWEKQHMTMVERVARAIASDSNTIWDNLDEGSRANYESMARAAIEAMREPTEEMLWAGIEDKSDDGLISRWESMIDSALEGK